MFCIATFGFGERYHNQINRLIESSTKFNDIPKIFVLTEKPEAIQCSDNVEIVNVNLYSENYTFTENNYYIFDFSVKRWIVKHALLQNYNKIVLVDCDVIFNHSWNIEMYEDYFVDGSISGQVVYDLNTAFDPLGKRYEYYKQHFGKEFHKELVTEVPEDCITLFNFESIDKGLEFINVWSKCIEVKNDHHLGNSPAGNIDEIAFAACELGIPLRNRYTYNLLVADHDKWYI